MRRSEVFAISLLLKGADRAESILALLDEEKLREVKAAIQEFNSSPAPDHMRQLWIEQRRIEEHVQIQASEEKFGFEERLAAPALVKWLVRRAN